MCHNPFRTKHVSNSFYSHPTFRAKEVEKVQCNFTLFNIQENTFGPQEARLHSNPCTNSYLDHTKILQSFSKIPYEYLS
ncbi:hypothetical protein KFK09_022487 [Dendrobium nobile]|uniref:Uncharacterized protein n=1 Tax=Dendrobium nobile TaxID=94219 RepID=A0A8T3AJA0_DENNO|nr:hypothetical protein KFK09_022487 [Dendrobium nobile]